jgi:fibronectin type 3 domain-containing protein
MKKVGIAIFAILHLTGCYRDTNLPTQTENILLIPPSNLTVFSAHDGEITIVWSPINSYSLTGYNVYMGTLSNSLRFQGFTPNNYYYVDSLSYDSTYYFRVTAVYSNGQESDSSNIVSAVPVNLSPPSKPAGVTVYGHNDNYGVYMNITWSSNQDGDLAGYEIYRGTNSNFIPDTLSFKNRVSVVKKNFYVDNKSLELDETYYYKVIAYDFGGLRSTPSDPASDMILEKVQLISPPNGSSVPYGYPVTFKFSNVAGASYYTVFVTSSIDGGQIWSTTVPAVQDSAVYSGGDFVPNQQYYWKVAASTVNPAIPNSMSNSFMIVVSQ